MKKTVIAHYRADKIWLQLAIISAVVCFPALVTFIVLHKKALGGLMHSADAIYVIPELALIWGFDVWLIMILFAVLRQLLFKHMEAVWVDCGDVIYLSRFAFAIRLSAIRSVSVDSLGKVVFGLENGKSKNLPTRSLREDAGEIESRIKAALVRAS